MAKSQFCFVNDTYFTEFSDKMLMKNKETINGKTHNRPCFFTFPDTDKPYISWLVPVSSKVDKYQIYYDKKVARYGRCNTIRFGDVLGKSNAFLIQNIFPVTDNYIKEYYLDKNNVPVRIDDRVATDVIVNAREVLAMVKRGRTGLVFPDIISIYKKLIEQITLENKQQVNNPASLRDRVSAIESSQNESSPPPMGKTKDLEK